MPRTIKPSDPAHIPDVASMIKTRKHPNGKTRQREAMLYNMARAYDLVMSYGPSGIYIFRNDANVEIKVFGLWAAYQFMRGYEFASLGREPDNVTHTPEGWRDESLWK